MAQIISEKGRRLALTTIIALMALGSARLLFYMVESRQLGIDFAPLWTGAHFALNAPQDIYDFDRVTAVQAAAGTISGHSLRPFVYPPTMLLALAPFAALPFAVPFFAFVVVSGALFLWAGRRLGGPWWFALTPPVAMAAAAGQVAFLTGGLILSGLLSRRSPVVAGVFFGIAGSLKPQLLILLPVALVAARAWRTILFTAITGVAMAAASIMAFGLAPWRDWLAALPRFQGLISASPSLLEDALSPWALLERFGFDGRWALCLAPLSIAMTWRAFSKAEDSIRQAIALLGGALLVTPYAMNYELALFAPAVAQFAAGAADRNWAPRYGLLFVYGLGFAIAGPLVLLLLALTAFSQDERPSAPAQALERGSG